MDKSRIFEMKPIPEVYKWEEYWFRKLLFGHTCPICKSAMLTNEMVTAYKIQPTCSAQQKHGLSKLYCKGNYMFTCSWPCMGKVQFHYADPLAEQAQLKFLADYVGNGRGLVKKIQRKQGDGYREIVMKECGIDPTLHLEYKVFSTIEEAIADFCAEAT